MLEVVICLAGMAGIIGLAEILWKKKILKGENQRKFLHIVGGTFVAFWPWLVSWRALQLMSVALLLGVVINRGSKSKLHFLRGPEREGYGDVYFAVAILLCSLLTDEKIFFALAILHLALADGFAAVVGKRYGQKMSYKVFNQTKTVLGSMTFWLISLSLLGGGVLYAYQSIDFIAYVGLLVFVPPILTLLENVTGYGLDNVVVPLVVLAALEIAQSSLY